MLNCRQATELCSLEMEQPLPLRERVGLHTHLMMCSGCSNFRRQLSALRQAAQAYARGEAASAGLDPPGKH